MKKILLALFTLIIGINIKGEDIVKPEDPIIPTNLYYLLFQMVGKIVELH